MSHPPLDPTKLAVSHIKPSHAFTLDKLINPDARPALFSCFADGKPAVALVNVSYDGKTTLIEPLFLAIDDTVILTDHNGMKPTWRQKAGGEG